MNLLNKTILIFCFFLFSAGIGLAQDMIIDSLDTMKTETEIIKDTCNNSKVKINILPYPFYSNVFKFGVGAFVSVSGLVSENSLIKAGGFYSTNSSLLGYFQYEEFQLPFFERLFFRPDLLFGKIGKVKNFTDLPLKRDVVYDTPAGRNNSDKDNYFEVDGIYQWYDFTLSYLLPIGYGKENVTSHPVLENGILVSGATGGFDLNPLKSGRTFLQTKLTYRRLDMTLANQKTAQTATGIEYILNVENLDYFWNPSKGYNLKLSYLSDLNALGGDNEFDMLKGELSWYIPLSEEKSKSPSILAFDIKTAHTLSWDEFDIKEFMGQPIKQYHRPPNFLGAYLGGPKTMRGYLEYRFSDRSSIYYCAEYRKILGWNPFNTWDFTRNIGVDWIELAFFGELGRVAPDWNMKTLHSDMKWDIGGGLRLFMGGFLIRLDAAHGAEGTLMQMFYDYSF